MPGEGSSICLSLWQVGGKKTGWAEKKGLGCNLCGCLSISFTHKALRGFYFPTIHLRVDFSLDGKTLRRFILMEKGVLAEAKGTCTAETQHSHHTHGLSIVAVKSHVVSPNFQFWGVFSMQFSFGAKYEIFYLFFFVPKVSGGEVARHMWSSFPPKPRICISSSSGSFQQLAPNQLPTLTEKVRAGDKSSQTTKPIELELRIAIGTVISSFFFFLPSSKEFFH